MRLQFDDWAFDSATREVTRSGATVHLSPKAFELLGILISRRPAAVAKSELKDLLWPGTFVADQNLPGLVAEIRSTLGDDARDPRVVRTVQRFGYAFCGRDQSSPAVSIRLPVLSAGSSYRLIFEDREVALPEGETIVGRIQECGVWLDSPSVSRRHARLRVTTGTATIEDLGSKNGTYVNEQRVAEAAVPLSDRDQIRIGTVSAVLRRLRESPTTTVTFTQPIGPAPRKN